MALNVHWIQHPVGHGGFHTGHMYATGGGEFTWVFDCGSRRKRKFEEETLLDWTDYHPQVDWLFLSHFDFDHVSGLETLLTGTVVREIMVPYVNNQELLFLLLYELSQRRRLGWGFFELAADPAAYFLNRGAQGVTFLRGEPPADEPDDEPGDRRPPREDRFWTVKITPEPRALKSPSSHVARGSHGHRVRAVDGGTCDIYVRQGALGLRLKPYRAPVKKSDFRGLIKALKALVGIGPQQLGRPGLGKMAYAIAHKARTRDGREKLKEVYRKFAGSSNRSSLSLLSTPVSPGQWCMGPYITHGDGIPAWMNTGDAELRTTADLTDWVASYGMDLANVKMLALPHHGSDHNSDAKLQKVCKDALLVAHTKADDPQHPGAVIRQIARRSRGLHCVTERRGSDVTMIFCAP